MGTAGALSLLKKHRAIFVMNGDLLTNLNFDNINFHIGIVHTLPCVLGNMTLKYHMV